MIKVSCVTTDPLPPGLPAPCEHRTGPLPVFLKNAPVLAIGNDYKRPELAARVHTWLLDQPEATALSHRLIKAKVEFKVHNA